MSHLVRRPPPGGSSSTTVANRPEWVGVGADNSAMVMDKGNQSMIHLTATAQDHVAAYLEYNRIVGDADGGTLFTEEEYEKFKANAIAHRSKNRIYVSWRNMNTGMDCRQIGPTSPCFCGHRYKQHATDNANKDIFCRQAGCPCKLYDYIPIRGTQDVKCTCKHSYDVHHVTGKRRCKTGGCQCSGFHTGISCSCKDQFCVHQTIFETREERQAGGRPVDNLAGGGLGYEAMGGITSFSSLVDGIDRMQIGPSGEPELVGAPPKERKKLTAEDEFALYDAKYKKGGSEYSAISRPRLKPRTTTTASSSTTDQPPSSQSTSGSTQPNASYSASSTSATSAASNQRGASHRPSEPSYAQQQPQQQSQQQRQHPSSLASSTPPRARVSGASHYSTSSSSIGSHQTVGGGGGMTCHSCGEANPVATARFCPHCGSSMR